MKAWQKELLKTGMYLVIVLCITLFIIFFVAQRTQVHMTSMYPTLSPGDNLIVEKVTYRFSNPKRFDIIVFKYSEKENYIKRVIGLPGETVSIDKQGNIYINGEVLQESYGREIIRADKIGDRLEKEGEITLGKDEYFVMGDNRNNSTDSRDSLVGNVKKSQIIGRAIFRFYPFDKMKTL